MNTTTQGEISEGHVIAHLLKRGYAVSIPFGNNQRYDLVIDDGSHLWRAQTKTARLEKGCLVFNCSNNGYKGVRKTYQGQIDLFLIYSPHTDKVYRVPIEAATVTSMMLRIDPTRAGSPKSPKHPIKWASDYELT